MADLRIQNVVTYLGFDLALDLDLCASDSDCSFDCDSDYRTPGSDTLRHLDLYIRPCLFLDTDSDSIVYEYTAHLGLVLVFDPIL